MRLGGCSNDWMLSAVFLKTSIVALLLLQQSLSFDRMSVIGSRFFVCLLAIFFRLPMTFPTMFSFSVSEGRISAILISIWLLQVPKNNFGPKRFLEVKGKTWLIANISSKIIGWPKMLLPSNHANYISNDFSRFMQLKQFWLEFSTW